MEDVVLKANLDDSTTLYVSPVTRQTYEEHVQDDNLGGDNGYFILRSAAHRLEILAKVPSLDAAETLFDLIVSAAIQSRKVSIR
jgi:hypothetical protein